jgi:hypothetical protein
MSLFSLKKHRERVGAIIDIGSASVLVAVVVSRASDAAPTIIWSHREHAPLRSADSVEQSAKAVMTAFMNALLKFDGEGRQALSHYRHTARISEVLCTIAAPWSYTVTKSINYAQDEPFEINPNLIEELVRTAFQKTTDELTENDSMNNLGLTVISRITLDVQANGYRIKHFEKEKAKALALFHASAVTQQYLINMIDDMKKKIFPGALSRKISYILALYHVTQRLFADMNDVCLVNITYEATEIGVVRDGVLQYSTHTAIGSFSLAREISEITSVPLYEAFGYLHTEKPYSFMDALPSNQREAIEAVFETYIERVAALFHETGDDLSIPKRIYLHADLMSEPLFVDLVEKAAKRSIKSDPLIKLITPKILKAVTEQTPDKKTPNFNDTAMLVSAQFFHTQNQESEIEYV